MSSLALATSEDTLNHWISKGKYHKRGKLSIDPILSKNNAFTVIINYKLKLKFGLGTIGKKFAKGRYEFELPNTMLVEQGYIDLKKFDPDNYLTLCPARSWSCYVRTMKDQNKEMMEVTSGDKSAYVRHMGRADHEGYYDSHEIEIRSKNTISPDFPEGKWHINLFFHPIVKSMGIIKTEIRYHGKLSPYNINSFL